MIVDEILVTSLIRELGDILILNNDKWIRRQTYALLCSHLLHNGAIAASMFTKEMLPNLLNLSLDRVPNVRLAVARTLANNVSTLGRKYHLGIAKYTCTHIYTYCAGYVIKLFYITLLILPVHGLGAERLDEVNRRLKKMRLDADRDVRMLAGGEEQLDTVPQDGIVTDATSQDRTNEEPRNILF